MTQNTCRYNVHIHICLTDEFIFQTYNWNTFEEITRVDEMLLRQTKTSTLNSEYIAQNGRRQCCLRSSEQQQHVLFLWWIWHLPFVRCIMRHHTDASKKRCSHKQCYSFSMETNLSTFSTYFGTTTFYSLHYATHALNTHSHRLRSLQRPRLIWIYQSRALN